jgi:hypothetical protein
MARSGRPRRPPLVVERRTVRLDEIGDVACGVRGCPRRFPFRGDLPAGWVCLLAYSSPQPKLDLTKVKDKEWHFERGAVPGTRADDPGAPLLRARVGARPRRAGLRPRRRSS